MCLPVARGFWESGGEINMAGELDMKDISTVIDWAILNLNADPDRIGLSGISYGGGVNKIVMCRLFSDRNDVWRCYRYQHVGCCS
jgi:predicted acyl esterase